MIARLRSTNWWRFLPAGLCLLLALLSLGSLVRNVASPSGDHSATKPGSVARDSDGRDTDPSHLLAESAEFIVCFFHGNVRCRSCRTIQRVAHDVVQADFADLLHRGQITWITVNYDKPAYRRWAVRWAVIAPTVVLIDRRNRDHPATRNLMDVWDHVTDETAMRTYLRTAIRSAWSGAHFDSDGGSRGDRQTRGAP